MLIFPESSVLIINDALYSRLCQIILFNTQTYVYAMRFSVISLENVAALASTTRTRLVFRLTEGSV
jgi:hypothetical protein